jgi:uncharacterized membrane protein YcaP (DUF421 family)
MTFWPDDWAKVFLPQVPIFESIIRASVIYLLLFILLRVLLKRESGGTSISDVLLLVLIADAVQNGIQGQAISVADAMILGGTLILWDWLINFLSYHFNWFYHLVHPRPLPVVIDGEIIRKNARRELLTRDDILQEMHLNGIEKLSDVAKATVQGNGAISFIRKENGGEGDKQNGNNPRNRKLPGL